jgi:transcription-repair coupling factor (superfamily II helicase)
MLPQLVAAFRRQAPHRALGRALPARGSHLNVGGLPGSSPAILVAALAEEHPQRVFLVVTPTPAAAEAWLSDLTALMGGAARLFPQREALGEEEPHLEIVGERVETLDAELS